MISQRMITFGLGVTMFSAPALAMRDLHLGGRNEALIIFPNDRWAMDDQNRALRNQNRQGISVVLEDTNAVHEKRNTLQPIPELAPSNDNDSFGDDMVECPKCKSQNEACWPEARRLGVKSTITCWHCKVKFFFEDGILMTLDEWENNQEKEIGHKNNEHVSDASLGTFEWTSIATLVGLGATAFTLDQLNVFGGTQIESIVCQCFILLPFIILCLWRIYAITNMEHQVVGRPHKVFTWLFMFAGLGVGAGGIMNSWMHDSAIPEITMTIAGTLTLMFLMLAAFDFKKCGNLSKGELINNIALGVGICAGVTGGIFMALGQASVVDLGITNDAFQPTGFLWAAIALGGVAVLALMISAGYHISKMCKKNEFALPVGPEQV